MGAETPLKGGLNTPMHDMTSAEGADGKTPLRTPNMVFGKTPQRTTGDEEVGTTNADPSQTPARDGLGLNAKSTMEQYNFEEDEDEDDFLGGDAGDLENQLESLPEPK